METAVAGEYAAAVFASNNKPDADRQAEPDWPYRNIG
jgi:hypothetical protein